MHGGQPYFAPRGPYLNRTSAVGSYRPNGFGLCSFAAIHIPRAER